MKGDGTIRSLQAEIFAWAETTYPGRTADSIIRKLEEERRELAASDHLDPLEYADLVILVLDLATIKGVDVQDAVQQKLAINYAREWKIDPETGLMNHIKTQEK